MERIKKYVDGLELENELETFGSDYFYNVTPYYCEGMYITVYYTNDAGKTRETCGKLEKVKRYCKRYGYTFKALNSPVGVSWYQIFKTTELETLLFYQRYIDLSVAECEKVIHENHINPALSALELNNKLREIMDFYGNNLKAFFNSVAA